MNDESKGRPDCCGGDCPYCAAPHSEWQKAYSARAKLEVELTDLRACMAELNRLRTSEKALLEAVTVLIEQPTMSPVDMSPKQRAALWDAHTKARAAIAQATEKRG